MTNRNELERLLAAATEGPWAVCTDATGDTFIASMTDSAETVCEMGAMDTGEGQAQLEADAVLICFLRNNAQHYLSLMDEVERLREALSKADEPHWFYAEGWEERCLHSPDDAIGLLDFAPGQYVTEVATARPCKSIWCAVRVTDDEDADDRYRFTEHSTEEEARQALGETHDN